MALIKCNHCGQMILDKAKACSKCGNSVDLVHIENSRHIVNQNQETQEQPEQTIMPETVEYYDEPVRKRNTRLIVSIVLGILTLLGIGGWLWNDNQQKLAEKERQLAIQAEQARLDLIAKAELLEKVRQDSITHSSMPPGLEVKAADSSPTEQTITASSGVSMSLWGSIGKTNVKIS